MRRVLPGLFALSCFSLLAACNEIQPTPTIDLTAPSAPQAAATRIALVGAPAELPAGGGTARIHIETTSGSIPARNIPVRLTATDGILAQTEITTDQTGHANVAWTGTQSAVITATSGDLTASMNMRVAAPPPPIPPDRIPPPPPTPTPAPVPTPPAPDPLPTLTITASAPTVPVNGTLTLTAAGTGFLAGETAQFFRWDFTNDGTFDETTTSPSIVSDPFTAHGPATVRAVMFTTTGRQVEATRQIVVTSALR